MPRAHAPATVRLCKSPAAAAGPALAFDPLESDNTWIDCNAASTPTTPVIGMHGGHEGEVVDLGRYPNEPASGR